MVKKTSGSGGALPFFIGFVAILLVGWWWFPRVLFSVEQQPIRFSHLVHVDNAGMACEDCHYLNEDGSFSGLPSTESCADCHTDAMGEDPEEQRFIDEYVNEEKEVPWLIYQDQPDNVFFSHAAHAAQDCTTCHPDVGASDTPLLYRNNADRLLQRRLQDRVGRGVGVDPAYSAGHMKMWECERCHAEKARATLYVCHRSNEVA
jgi:hypothetical protein